MIPTKKRLLSTLKRLIAVATVALSPLIQAKDITFSGYEIRMQYNDWSWKVVDESGKPLQGVMVFDNTLSFGPSSYKQAALNAIAETFQLPQDVAPACQAIENWIRNNPEPMELAQLENMYTLALPIELFFRNFTNNKGLHEEHRIMGEQIHDSLRIFFKPGYYPVVLQYGFGPPPLHSEDNIVVTIKMKQWPERMQSLSQRPWVKENLNLQTKNDIQRRKSYKSNSIFNNYPSLKLAQQIKTLENKALEENYTKDAAWLHIASAYAPKKLAHRIDSSGEKYNFKSGRIYTALDEAVKIEPNIQILNEQKNIRDFILRFPNGIKGSIINLDPDIPDSFFNNEAIWTKSTLDDYLATIKPYEDDPFTTIALTSQLAGNGLVLNSAPEIREAFFNYRTQLRIKLMSLYPTIGWHASGIDQWDKFYDKAFGHPYYIQNRK